MKKMKVDTNPITVVTEVLSSVELLRDPVQITTELFEENPRFIESIQIDPPIGSTINLEIKNEVIVDGFTPGATKNIISTDLDGLMIHSVTETSIKLFSYSKIHETIQRRSCQNKQIIKIQNFIFLIPNQMRYYDEVSDKEKVERMIKLEVCQKTGKIVNQGEVELSSSLPYHFLGDLGLGHPSNDIQSTYCSLFNYNIEDDNFQLIKPQSTWLYKLNKHGFFFLMKLPVTEFTHTLKFQSKTEQFNQKVREQFLAKFPLLNCSLRSTHQSSHKIFNFDAKANQRSVIVENYFGQLLLKFVDKRTKKIYCSKFLSVLEVIGNRLEEFYQEALQRNNNIGIQNQNIECKFHSYLYLEGDKKLVGLIQVGNLYIPFVIKDLFTRVAVTLGIPYEDTCYLSQFSCDHQVKELFYHLRVAVNTQNLCNKLLKLNPSTLELEEIFGSKHKYDEEIQIYYFQAHLFTISKKTVIFKTPDYYKVINLEEKKVESSLKTVIRFGFGEDTMDPVLIIRDWLIWKEDLILNFGRLSDENKRGNNALQLRDLDQVDLGKFLSREQGRIRSYKQDSVGWFQIDEDTYTVWALIHHRGPNPEELSEFIKIDFRTTDFEVKKIRNYPLRGKNKVKFGDEPQVYHTEGFFVTSSFSYERELDQDQENPTPRLEKHQISLSSLEFELLDSFEITIKPAPDSEFSSFVYPVVSLSGKKLSQRLIGANSDFTKSTLTRTK